MLDGEILICKITINIKKFLDYLLSEGLAVSEEWINVIELGNEIAGNLIQEFGEGTTFIKKFEVEYS
jgi:hypothetical protein